ncbi:hypothetical protein [Nonomuraea rubra]|uniref:hypothetical protein n=1 Tax=Nonomuraea rubra TaxID=46180 RepID=UPI0033FCB488
MSVTITDDTMTSDQNDTVATLVDAEAGLWTVTGRHGVYTRNQAITAMTIAEYKARVTPHPNDAVFVASWEQELLVPPMPRDPWALLQTLKAAASAVRALPGTDEFAAPPFGGDIGECLLRIGDSVVDIGAAVDKLADLANERGDDAEVHEWYRAEERASSALPRLRDAGGELHAAGIAAQRAQVEGARASK